MDAVDRPADDDGRVALGILGELFRDRPVVGIDAVGRVLGFGALHCLTQRQPVSTEQPWGYQGIHVAREWHCEMAGNRLPSCRRRAHDQVVRADRRRARAALRPTHPVCRGGPDSRRRWSAIQNRQFILHPS
jgi:hypothetical protein